MTATQDRGAIAFAEKLLALLDEGKFTATYKFAVLLALMDLCLERTSRTGEAPTVLTTRQLAEKILELYWPHTTPCLAATGAVLRQNARGQAEILSAIEKFRRATLRDPSAPLERARAMAPGPFERLARYVEWKLVEMPLPRLQVVGDAETPFIYQIAWNTSVRSRHFRDGDAFDNRIQLIEGAGEYLVQLAGLLRPLIQRQWATMVARFNDLDEARLDDLLFGAQRVSTVPVRAGLIELQDNRCFYCSGRLGGGCEIDHFLPWARYPDNDVENLVAADRRCNGSKRAFLAAGDHVARWAARLDTRRSDLALIASQAQWAHQPERSLGVARAVYLRLPDGAKLWHRGREFVDVDRALLSRTLIGSA